LTRSRSAYGYELDGACIDHLPARQGAQAREPVYETFEGWKDTTAGARSWADLPAQAVKYVRQIEELIGAPVALLSTSPERDDTILMPTRSKIRCARLQALAFLRTGATRSTVLASKRASPFVWRRMYSANSLITTRGK
jgi:hypothetical protein